MSRLEYYNDEYKWVKVKRYVNDPDKDWEGKFKSLLIHHQKETEFLISEIRKLAAELDSVG